MRAPPVHDVLLVAGPPGSAVLWSSVRARWEGVLHAEAVELFEPVPADPTVQGLAQRLADRVASAPRPLAVVAHGTAVPVALAAASLSPPARLVLSDGPIHRLDPFTRALASLCRVPRIAANTLLQPAFLERWLSSSAGLRRAVVNPYVMDRDTVVALLAPLVRTPQSRLALARFLGSLPEAVRSPHRFEGPTLLCWGELDPLYPIQMADEARRWLPRATTVSIPGGQHMHPEERPWEIADQVAAWLTREPTTT